MNWLETLHSWAVYWSPLLILLPPSALALFAFLQMKQLKIQRENYERPRVAFQIKLNKNIIIFELENSGPKPATNINFEFTHGANYEFFPGNKEKSTFNLIGFNRVTHLNSHQLIKSEFTFSQQLQWSDVENWPVLKWEISYESQTGKLYSENGEFDFSIIDLNTYFRIQSIEKSLENLSRALKLIVK